MIFKINNNLGCTKKKCKIILLNNDIIYLINKKISKYTNIKCHICNKSYKIEEDFYKKQNKFYYCSKQCYEFI